jgi:hypothetical protein
MLLGDSANKTDLTPDPQSVEHAAESPHLFATSQAVDAGGDRQTARRPDGRLLRSPWNPRVNQKEDAHREHQNQRTDEQA